MTLPQRAAPADSHPARWAPATLARRRVRQFPWAGLALLLYASAALAATVLSFAVTLPLLDEAGYPDTYMLYDAREYARTGRIYRAATEAPYNPSLYSPLFYLALSLPFRVSEPANPFLIPRLTVALFFALCVLVTVSMTHRLFRHRSVVLWSRLLGGSILLVGPWIPQLRADFMAVFFGLLSARTLMSRSRWAAPLAGLAAGAALAFKLTVVAAALSGLVWLLWDRRWRHAAQFLAAAVVAGAGGYLVFWPSEPHMVAHLFVLKSSLRDYAGGARLVYFVVSEPVFLLALSALPLALHRPDRKRRLLLLYGATSLLIASAAAMHPGAAMNYFIEALLICVPLASVVPARLFRLPDRAQAAQILLAALILLFLAKPAIEGVGVQASLKRDVIARNAEWIALESVLRDRRVFSAVPEVAFRTRTPPVTEPFLIRFLELTGRYDTGPLADRIRAREFDVVVTLNRNYAYRGVELLSPSIQRAIQGAYAPFCIMGRTLYHLPGDRRESGSLGDGLLRLGCRLTRADQHASPVDG